MNLSISAMILCFMTTTLLYADISIPMFLVSESAPEKPVGAIEVTETKFGLLFTPKLYDLKGGLHGFHIHQNPSCGNHGMDAGGHHDPYNTGKHLGPYIDDGHLGDLPAIFVGSDGSSTLSVLAPRMMHLDEIRNHSLMIHEGGDNYSDMPDKLGGGGTRMMCGVIK